MLLIYGIIPNVIVMYLAKPWVLADFLIMIYKEVFLSL